MLLVFNEYPANFDDYEEWNLEVFLKYRCEFFPETIIIPLAFDSQRWRDNYVDSVIGGTVLE